MGAAALSLLAGMASGYATKSAEEEKLGSKFGEYAFSTLYDNYKTSKKDYDERQNLYIDTATKLREFSNNYGYSVSEGELKEAISSPSFVSEFSRAMTKPDFDPSKVEWQKLFSKIDKEKTKDFTGSVEDFIKGEFKMPTATSVGEGVLKQQAPISGLYAGAREKGYKTTFEGAAKASGVPMESLMGASGGITPKTTISGSKSQFNFDAFRPESLDDIGRRLSMEQYNLTANVDPKNPPLNHKELVDQNNQQLLRWREAKRSINPSADSFTEMKSDAMTGLAHARQTNDKEKINAALAKLNDITEIEYLAANSHGGPESQEKAEARLMSNAVKISKMPKGKERDDLEKTNNDEMKTRAKFYKIFREEKGLTEGEKDRQVGLATLANMLRRNIFEYTLPKGAITPQADGSFTINNLPGLKDEQIKAAGMTVQKRLIEMLTNNGVPVDNASKQILMANLVNFDANGKATVNSNLGPFLLPSTEAPTTPSQPTAAPTPQAALPKPPVAAPTAPPATAPAAPTAPPATAPAAPTPVNAPVTVKLPNGKTATFPNAKAAEEFKTRAGIK
jgi:hypothetical protein